MDFIACLLTRGLHVSRFVISSKVIARDLERGRDSAERRFYPGKITALIAVNVLLWLSILAIAVTIDLI